MGVQKEKNGVYRARLVGLGYSQIPGVDHKDNVSPVVTDTTFRCVLVIALLNEWDMEVVDIEKRSSMECLMKKYT